MFNPFSIAAEQDIIIPAILKNQTDTDEFRAAQKRLRTKRYIILGLSVAGFAVAHLAAAIVDKKSQEMEFED